MHPTPVPGTVAEWRPRGRRLLTLLLPLLVVLTSGTSVVLRLLHPGGDRHAGVDLVLGSLLVVGAAVSVLVATRTRVRVLPEGLEVRELRTRTYAWSSIADVRVDRWSGSRTVAVELTDGSVRTLPAPVASRGTTSELTAVVEAVRRHLPADARPADGPTPLDDLLHE